MVPEQADFDGNFFNVPYRIPNPEVPESMEMAKALAEELCADLVLSTDPDADRLGAMVPLPGGGWKFLTGNEIAALVSHFILELRQKAGTLPDRPVIIKTEVTSELIAAIAEHFGARCIGHLLVGFKYIAELLRQIEEEGRCGDVEAEYGDFAYSDFILGAEESHGMLVTPEIRDKDAAGAALALAELVSILKDAGNTLDAYLRDIYRELGCFANALVPLVMRGARGVANIGRIQDTFRKNPPAEIAGVKVQRFVDHWSEEGIFGPIKSGTDRSSRNVLVFHLEDGSRVALRPSGTEPKTKIYVETRSDPMPGAGDDELAAAMDVIRDRAAELADDLTRKALAVVGEDLPDFALRISGLVSVDDKKDFAENFLKELDAKAADVLAGAAVLADACAWVDERLGAYGKDPRGLVADAFELYMRGAVAEAERVGDQGRLAILEKQRDIFSGTKG
jgi:phosphoglucomutase/phosphomannomutase